jgi:hypothetical protein
VLSILLITPLIAVSAIPPCLITTIRVSSKFGALRERCHIRRIWLQFSKTLKGEIMQPGSFSDMRRRVHQCDMFSFILCLLLCIRLVTLYRIKPGSQYFPQPLLLGLVICTAFGMSRAWRSNMFLEHSIRKVRGSTLVPSERALSHHHHHDRNYHHAPISCKSLYLTIIGVQAGYRQATGPLSFAHVAVQYPTQATSLDCGGVVAAPARESERHLGRCSAPSTRKRDSSPNCSANFKVPHTGILARGYVIGECYYANSCQSDWSY